MSVPHTETLPKRASFLGCAFDLVTPSEAREQCLRWCTEPRKPHILATVNASILVMMRKDRVLREACDSSDLIVPDGVPVVWASRFVGTPLKERVAGVALMYDLLSAADERKLRVYFLGARQEVLDALKEVCIRDFPGLQIVGSRNGYFDENAWPELVSEIRDSRADILFVGMPTPFKEVWCHEHKDALDVPVIMGVGGSFDVVAGYVRRAPTVMQNMGLEWFWRLLMEPRRMWKRYLSSNTAFLWLTFRSMLHNRLSPKTH